MLGRLTATLTLGLLIFTTCAARAATNHPRHEVWLGLGGAASFEKNVFGTPNGIASTPDAEFGDLSCTGVSACAGPGASMRFGRNFMLSAEGIGPFGVATWERAPFANSSGKDFNPSLVGGTVNLSLAGGTKPAPGPGTPPATVKDSSLAQSRRGPSVGRIILNEALLALCSCTAYDENKGTLPGITLATGLLGTAAGPEFKNPRSPWIVLGATIGIATAEFVMANNGASQDALFVTSMVSWNAVIITVDLGERKAGRAAKASH